MGSPVWPSPATILAVKDLPITFAPVLLVEIEWSGGRDEAGNRLPPLATLRLAPMGINYLESGVSGLRWNGNDYLGRIKNPDVGQAMSMSGSGVAMTPGVRLILSDPDRMLWNYWNVPYGFRGATMKCRLVFWEVGTTNFSSDSKFIFYGTCNGPDESNDQLLILEAIAKLNLQRVELPTTRIQRRCFKPHPDNAAQKREAEDPWSIYYPCGDTDPTHTSCNHTPDNCVANGMWVDRQPPLVKATDSDDMVVDWSRWMSAPRRFGGVGTWMPPQEWSGRAHLSEKDEKGKNLGYNIALYNDFVPILYGRTWIEPMILTILGDPNFSRCEAIVCDGQIVDSIQTLTYAQLICNDESLMQANSSSARDKLIPPYEPGWWGFTSTGARDGTPTADAPYNLQGDCFGSLAVIQVVMVRGGSGAFSSDTVPTIRFLVSGAKIREWRDAASPPAYITEPDNANPVWIIADLLKRGKWSPDELDIQTFINAANHCNEYITYKGMNWREGMALNTQRRYTASLAITKRRSLQDILQGMLTGCKAILVGGDSEKLQIYIKKTLAEENPQPVPGSNDNSPYDSWAVKSGPDGGPPPTQTGYVAYHFNDSNILREPSGLSSLRAFQRRISETPNKISYEFFDANNGYQLDSLSIVDTEDVERTGQELVGPLPVEGINTQDGAKRAIRCMLAELLHGNPKLDSSGTFWFRWKASINALHLRPGQIVALSSKRMNLGLGAGPEDYPQKILVRITAIRPAPNWSEIEFEGFWHIDIAYTDYFGQEPDPAWEHQFRSAKLRPPYMWQPYDCRVNPADPIYQRGWTFSIQEKWETVNEEAKRARIVCRGKKPVNLFSDRVRPPFVHHQMEVVDVANGHLRPDKQYFACIVAKEKRDPAVTTVWRVSAPSLVAMGITSGAGAGAAQRAIQAISADAASIYLVVDNNSAVDDYVEITGTVGYNSTIGLAETIRLGRYVNLNGSYRVAARTANTLQLDHTYGAGVATYVFPPEPHNAMTSMFSTGYVQTVMAGAALALTKLSWHNNTGAYMVFVGESEATLTFAFEDNSGNLPETIYITDEPSPMKFEPPDVQFNRLVPKARRVYHPGIFLATVKQVDEMTDTPQADIGIHINGGVADAEWVGRIVSILGDYHAQFRGNGWSKPINYTITAAAGETITGLCATPFEVVEPESGTARCKISNHGFETGDICPTAVGELTVTRLDRDWFRVSNAAPGVHVDVSPRKDGISPGDAIRILCKVTAASGTTITDSMLDNDMQLWCRITPQLEKVLDPSAATTDEYVVLKIPFHPFADNDAIKLKGFTDTLGVWNGNHNIGVVDEHRVWLKDVVWNDDFTNGGYSSASIRLRGLRPGEEVGRQITFLAGKHKGYSVPITGNTMDTITVSAWPWVNMGIPDTTDQFIIEDQGFISGGVPTQAIQNDRPQNLSADTLYMRTADFAGGANQRLVFQVWSYYYHRTPEGIANPVPSFSLAPYGIDDNTLILLDDWFAILIAEGFFLAGAGDHSGGSDISVPVDGSTMQGTVVRLEVAAETADGKQTVGNMWREVYVFAPPFRNEVEHATWALAIGGDLTAGTNVANQYEVRKPGYPIECVIEAHPDHMPSAITRFDINCNGTSIFPAATPYIELDPAGGNRKCIRIDFAEVLPDTPLMFLVGDILTCDVDSVAGTPGHDYTIQLKWGMYGNQ